MKLINTVILVCCSVCCFGQRVTKIIKEDEVSRILKTLSADAMMGRPAAKPEKIEPATAFIEKEFKKIGLKPLKGLNGFRQSFEKERISIASVHAVVDGAVIAEENIIVVSDKQDINVTNNLPVKVITFDSTVVNKNQHFRSRAYSFLRDTTSAIMLVAADYQDGFRQLKTNLKQRFTNNRKYTKVFILGKTAATDYLVKAHQKVEVIPMANVVGVLEGKSKPEEMVLFSAHYDHIGILPTVDGDSIANGADDDASGTTAVIALARYFKKIKTNSRTLIFVAFTAEEIGGFGSQYFSRQLDPDKVIAMFNIEMIGKPSKWGQNSAFMSGYERSDLGSILEKNLAGTGFSIYPDPYPQQNLFYRSDNATLARLGVPAHSISTDQIDVDAFYHTVNDEFETIDMKNITAAIRAIALSAKTIVEGTDTPSRIDKSTVN